MENGSVHANGTGMNLKRSYQENPVATFHGVVKRIVRVPGAKEKVEIVIQGADDLYREIRVPNLLQNVAGEQVQLQPGTDVAIIVVALASKGPPLATQVNMADGANGKFA